MLRLRISVEHSPTKRFRKMSKNTGPDWKQETFNASAHKINLQKKITENGEQLYMQFEDTVYVRVSYAVTCSTRMRPLQ